ARRRRSGRCLRGVLRRASGLLSLDAVYHVRASKGTGLARSGPPCYARSPMFTFVIVLHVIVSIFLIFVILLQPGKGDAMAALAGGGAGTGVGHAGRKQSAGHPGAPGHEGSGSADARQEVALNRPRGGARSRALFAQVVELADTPA